MSDLKIVLMVLGALIIAGVLVYNWLQERKLRNEVTNEFIVPQKDVLAEDFYIDTDAYVEKELAGIGSKTKSSMQSKPTAMADKPAIAEPVLAVFDDNVLNEATSDTDIKTFAPIDSTLNEPVQDHFISAYDTKAELQSEFLPETPAESTTTESIVKADLHQQTQGLTASLPNVVHSQIDLSAILYATKNIDVNQMQALKTTIADIGLSTVSLGSVMLHGLDSEDKWHLLSESTPSANFKQVACSLPIEAGQLPKIY